MCACVLTSSMYSPLMSPSRRENSPPFLASSFVLLLVNVATSWTKDSVHGDGDREGACGWEARGEYVGCVFVVCPVPAVW